MKSALLYDRDGLRTFVLVLSHGDEAAGALAAFARNEGLHAAHFTAVGAFERAVVAFFDWESKQYRHIPIDGQMEVLSLVGDIADDRGQPKVHAHVVLGAPDASAHGGHLIEGYVRPTLEITITETPARLRRRVDPESGLALIDP